MIISSLYASCVILQHYQVVIRMLLTLNIHLQVHTLLQ